MLDSNLLRYKLDNISKKLAYKKFTLDTSTIRQWEHNRKILQSETEQLQAKRNFYSKIIGIKKSKGENIKYLYQKVNNYNERLNITKNKLYFLQKTMHNYLVSIPNIPADDVPYGHNQHDNKEILRWGQPKKYNFPILDHVELGENLGEIDFYSAIKLTGTRFVVMKGQIARLHRMLIQFMLDIHIEQHGYLEYYVPYLVNQTSLYGTGQLMKFSDDLFHISSSHQKLKDHQYSLIPTAEVPLVNLVRNKIIEETALPIKMTAHTPCFRSEAGSYGKDTRGLIRMHQFDKIEIVQIVQPSHSMQTLEDMTKHAETILKLLKLPYRKMLLCTGDMSFTACKTYDLEVWLPTQNSYREISSCSNISDFQARRIQARYRNKIDKKINLVHTLNGSGLAVGRTLLAILENYQLSDGRIEIPEILQPYMKGLTYIG